MYLKSCTWWWDYKFRVATSLKLFISHVIAPLPPGYLNSLLYLSLRMKSSHLKIITASSVLCPEMTTHFSPSLLLSMAEKPQTHLLWDPDTEKLFILKKSFRPHQFLHCFSLRVLEGAARLCNFTGQFPVAFGDEALLNISLQVVRAGHSGNRGSSARLVLEKLCVCIREWDALASGPEEKEKEKMGNPGENWGLQSWRGLTLVKKKCPQLVG